MKIEAEEGEILRQKDQNEEDNVKKYIPSFSPKNHNKTKHYQLIEHQDFINSILITILILQ
jgi:hypothetical protein